MKQNKCGKIITQNKARKQLLKQYNTTQTVNYNRIYQIKRKYIKPQSLSYSTNLEQSSVFNISNTMQQSCKYSILMGQDYQYPLKQKIITQNNNYIKQFTQKVEKSNYHISYKLDGIEEEINKLKNLKITNNIVERQKITQQCLKNQKNSGILQQDKGKTRQREILKQKLTISSKFQKMQQSTCKLFQEFNSQKQYTQQFTVFINRIKDQISLDFDFTQILLSISTKQRQAIKQFIQKKYIKADVEFFILSPMQIDPFHTQNSIQKPIDIQQMSHRLYQFYSKIQNHFNIKLLRKFSFTTVSTLFEEIGQKQTTIGHLISYINMQTGNQFRNRAIIKLLKRLQISTHVIDPKLFLKFFVNNQI